MSDQAPSVTPAYPVLPASAVHSDVPRRPGPTAGTQPYDQRLVIEEGPRKGVFVYKTVDRVTGEIIRQYPREQLVKMSEEANYRTGAVVDTRA